MKQLSDLNENSTVEDFLEYFKEIPEDKWCTGAFNVDEGICCARGHLGTRDRERPTKLDLLLLTKAPFIADINNGHWYSIMPEEIINISKMGGIKNRVIAYLEYIAKNKPTRLDSAA